MMVSLEQPVSVAKLPPERGGGILKQPVFGIYEHNGRVYTEIILYCSVRSLQSIISA